MLKSAELSGQLAIIWLVFMCCVFRIVSRSSAIQRGIISAGHYRGVSYCMASHSISALSCFTAADSPSGRADPPCGGAHQPSRGRRKRDRHRQEEAQQQR